jgi:hypothetical protein
MLVLSRKESQRIRLGDDIVVTIVKISGESDLSNNQAAAAQGAAAACFRLMRRFVSRYRPVCRTGC